MFASMQQPGSILHHKQHFQPFREITPSKKSVSITAQNTLTDGCKILRDPCIRIFVVNAPSQDTRYGVDVIAVYNAMRLYFGPSVHCTSDLRVLLSIQPEILGRSQNLHANCCARMACPTFYVASRATIKATGPVVLGERKHFPANIGDQKK